MKAASSLQLIIPGHIRGRVFGLFMTLTAWVTPISMGLSGLVADLLNKNMPLIYAVCGLFILFFSIIMSLNKDFRNFLRQ